MKVIIIGLLLLSFILVLASQSLNIQDTISHREYIAEPGRRYKVLFPNPVDDLEVGTTLKGVDGLSASPLAPTFPNAIILKADDLKGNISSRFARYIELVREKDVATSLGLIVSTLLGADEANITTLRDLAKSSSFEIWLHGWSHYSSPKEDKAYKVELEFQGSGLRRQIQSLQWSLDLANLVLGIDLHTFGAPYNSYDGDTVKALGRFSSLKVWLYGPQTTATKLLVLPRPGDVSIEQRVGVVIDPQIFQKLWEDRAHRNVLVFQLHPNQWDDEDFNHFEKIIDFLKALPDYQFMTPYTYYQLIHDRDRITITKVSRTEYILDFTKAEFPHRLSFTVTPRAFILLPINLARGLVAYWHFDESHGDQALDASGHGNTGTLENGPHWVEGKFGSALQFDGVDDTVTIPHSDSLMPTKAITLAAWVKIAGPSQGYHSIIGKGGYGSGYRLLIHGDSGKVLFRLTGQEGYNLRSSITITNNEWHFIVATYDGFKMRLYIDGAKDPSEKDREGPIDANTSPVMIGRPQYAFNGLIDEVRIYNRALSGEEIKELFQMGQP